MAEEKEGEEESQKRRREDGVTIKLPFLNATITGRNAIGILCVFALSAVPAYFFCKHMEASEAQAAMVVKELKEVKTFMQMNIESQDATTYVLSLNQQQRDALNLGKPSRIRAMERDERNRYDSK